MDQKGLSSIPLPNSWDNSSEKDGKDEMNNKNTSVFSQGPSFLPAILGNIKMEDVILLVLIVVLLSEGSGCDNLLVGVLIVLFLSGIDGNPFGF